LAEILLSLRIYEQKRFLVLELKKLVDAIGIASGFNGITNMANATGIPLDARTEEVTVSLRQQTGIDDYSENHKSSIFG